MSGKQLQEGLCCQGLRGCCFGLCSAGKHQKEVKEQNTKQPSPFANSLDDAEEEVDIMRFPTFDGSLVDCVYIASVVLALSFLMCFLADLCFSLTEPL